MEEWKDIKGYEGIYQVSDLGRVKSLHRVVSHAKSGILTIKERMLKNIQDTKGYYQVRLSKDGKVTVKKVHQLVSIAFLNHQQCGFELVVNHKDFDKLNNKLDNLEITTQRINSNQKHLKSTSEYIGVSFHNKSRKWYACISINMKTKNLGYFINEYDAHLAYEKALKDFLNQS